MFAMVDGGLSLLASQMFLLAAFENAQNYALLLGVAAFSGGILLMFSHKRHLDEVIREQKDERVLQFELRKYRRRATSSALIASVGCMLAALFWVSEPRIFVTFISLILLTLVAIFGLAIVDIFSVGLQSISRTDEPARKELIEEYLRNRKKQAAEEKDES
jgi:uncharacterized membrane protein